MFRTAYNGIVTIRYNSQLVCIAPRRPWDGYNTAPVTTTKPGQQPAPTLTPPPPPPPAQVNQYHNIATLPQLSEQQAADMAKRIQVQQALIKQAQERQAADQLAAQKVLEEQRRMQQQLQAQLQANLQAQMQHNRASKQ